MSDVIFLQTIVSAYNIQKKGWVRTPLSLVIDDQNNVSIDEASLPSMKGMDGWVFDVSAVLNTYKVVDEKKYGLYDEHSKTLKLVDATMFDNMKEL